MRSPHGFKIGSRTVLYFQVRPGVWKQDQHPEIQKYILLCQDCDGFDDPYMLRDDLWKQVVPQNGLVCLACLTKRMGRPLVLEDLKDFESLHKLPINRPIYAGFQMGLKMGLNSVGSDTTIDSHDPLPIRN